MYDKIYYWRVPLPEWDFPVKISERINHKKCMHLHNWALHWHEHLEFQYVIDGAIQISCDDETRWLYSGDVFFANWCKAHHTVDFEDNTHYYVIQVDLAWLIDRDNDRRLAEYYDNLLVRSRDFKSFITQDISLNRIFDNIISENIRRESGFDIIIKSDLLKIIGTLFRRHMHTSENNDRYNHTIRYVTETLTYITQNYNQTLDLDILSDEIGITKSYLCHIFKQHTGYTIVQYINQLRCYRAIPIMANGVNVAQAATEVGYSDYNYFSRIFKKIIGSSPSEMTK